MPGPSAEFASWAKTHNLTKDDALEAATRGLPSKVLYLGETADSRAIPLLRQALLSRNFMVQAYAAMELAQLHDQDSIPLIVEACRRAPAEAAGTIAAISLPLFDDRRAQSALKEFAPAFPAGKDAK